MSVTCWVIRIDLYAWIFICRAPKDGICAGLKDQGISLVCRWLIGLAQRGGVKSRRSSHLVDLDIRATIAAR